MNISFYLYRDVKVIKTGKIGMVIDTDNTCGKVLVEFPNGDREWCYESDVLIVSEEEA